MLAIRVGSGAGLIGEFPVLAHGLALIALLAPFDVPPAKTLNPWILRADEAIAQVQRNPTPSSYARALECTFRADRFADGLKLAHEALANHPGDASLVGPAARALWRAGQISEAEALAPRVAPDSKDPIALSFLLTMHMARGEIDQMAGVAERLAACPRLSATDYSHLIEASFKANRLDGLESLIRKSLRLADPKNGYPETFFEENMDGVADFLAAAGPAPLNQVTKPGSAPMPVSGLNLPMVEAFVNGKGPYRFIVDTGGSIMLSLDAAVAQELGIRFHGKATVRGVAGTEETHQALIDDFRIGEIRMTRVMTRVFEVSKALMHSADGIVGTGMFGDYRMTLDFNHGRIIVGAAGSTAAAGEALPIRVVGDAKLIPLIKVENEFCTGLFDSGADAVAHSPRKLAALFPGVPIQEVEMGAALGVGGGDKPSISIGPGTRLEIGKKIYEKLGGVGLNVLDDTMSPMLGVQVDVLLGMPVMRDMKTLTVDYPSCRMWVEWME